MARRKKNIRKARAGRKGGRALVRRYGEKYMQEIGRHGAQEKWRRWRQRRGMAG